MVEGKGNRYPDHTRLMGAAEGSLRETLGTLAHRWLLVDVANQQLFLREKDTPRGHWPLSTAAVGIDARQDSGGTPPGVHRIASIIGLDQPLGTIFKNRQPTGEFFSHDQAARYADRDLILTRILTLEGCQAGINRGPGIDSLERYIYLHGTNHEDLLGRPASHGCIRLANRDIIEVCDLVHEGDPVVII